MSSLCLMDRRAALAKRMEGWLKATVQPLHSKYGALVGLTQAPQEYAQTEKEVVGRIGDSPFAAELLWLCEAHDRLGRVAEPSPQHEDFARSLGFQLPQIVLVWGSPESALLEELPQELRLGDGVPTTGEALEWLCAVTQYFEDNGVFDASE